MFFLLKFKQSLLKRNFNSYTCPSLNLLRTVRYRINSSIIYQALLTTCSVWLRLKASIPTYFIGFSLGCNSIVNYAYWD